MSAERSPMHKSNALVNQGWFRQDIHREVTLNDGTKVFMVSNSPGVKAELQLPDSLIRTIVDIRTFAEQRKPLSREWFIRIENDEINILAMPDDGVGYYEIAGDVSNEVRIYIIALHDFFREFCELHTKQLDKYVEAQREK